MEESCYIHKSYNVIVLIYHLVTPAKYRRVIFNQELDDYLCKICEDIEVRYELRFLEIGVDKDYVHFLLQSIPMYSPTRVTHIIKSIASNKMFKKYPNLKEKLWGSEFWSKGYFMSTGKALVMKRMMPRAKGRTARINKFFSNLYITVTEKEDN